MGYEDSGGADRSLSSFGDDTARSATLDTGREACRNVLECELKPRAFTLDSQGRPALLTPPSFGHSCFAAALLGTCTDVVVTNGDGLPDFNEKEIDLNLDSPQGVGYAC
jgi:hypothetical protein